jgi:nucleotide-binding universal stress UspA family protein
MFEKVLLCVTEATPPEVVESAIKLCSKKGEITVLHVTRRLSEFSQKEAQERFAWVLERLKKAGLRARLEVIESKNPGEAIVEFAKKNSCDALITGIVPPRGLLGRLSNITDYLLKRSPCTVVLVRKKQ